MAEVRVFHNPNFLDYDGRHRSLIPPVDPVAVVTVPLGLSEEERLAVAYQQTQHLTQPWYNQAGVRVLVRSTSVGDFLQGDDGRFFVVERLGFRPYQPRAIYPLHRLAQAYQELVQALDEPTQEEAVTDVARQLRGRLHHFLETEGLPQGKSPILPWSKAQVGDLVGGEQTGFYRVIARNLQPKWRARRLLAHIPAGQIWIDSPRSWAILVPVDEEVSR